MKKQILTLFALAALAATACKKDDNNGTTTTPSTTDSTNVTVSGDISSNTTWKKGRKYKLNGFVYVTNGATLTIEPGTIITGDKASKGTLVITRGAKINAVGTASDPIVFTSAVAAGGRSQGDWGGVILLGKAPINVAGGEAKIEGGLVPTSGGDEKAYIWFGGSDANDNSGTMKYVRIEFAGIAFSPDNEINGLTMGGVGAGTSLSYIQVYRSGDDSYEWFGGTVNCDHLVATYGWDDDWDTDNGFSGKVQFCVSQRVKTIADQSGSNGFESDNDANGSDLKPQTKAMFSNMTVIGPIATALPYGSLSGINANFQNGAQIRRNSSQSIYNSVIVGWPVGLYIDDTKGTLTSTNVASGSLAFKNNVMAGNGKNSAVSNLQLKASTAAATALAAWYTASGNVELDSAQQLGFSDAYKFATGVSSTSNGRPNYLLKAGSIALTGADFSGLTGFQTVTYRGAFDASTDWTTGWTNFDAENTAY